MSHCTTSGAGRGFSGWLRRFAPDAERRDSIGPNRAAIEQIRDYLAGRRTDFDLQLDVRGTDFQLAVWRELERIPYGETRSYAQVARTIGHDRAVRAVGAANGANPIPLILPCHRVIAADGGLGGYGGGLDLKRRLLAMEQSLQHQGSLL